jgi:hypothetical protein
MPIIDRSLHQSREQYNERPSEPCTGTKDVQKYKRTRVQRFCLPQRAVEVLALLVPLIIFKGACLKFLSLITSPGEFGCTSVPALSVAAWSSSRPMEIVRVPETPSLSTVVQSLFAAICTRIHRHYLIEHCWRTLNAAFFMVCYYHSILNVTAYIFFLFPPPDF